MSTTTENQPKKKLSRADKKKHKGIEFTRRKNADAIKEAIAKLVEKGIASPFDYEQAETALADAKDTTEMNALRQDFINRIKTLSVQLQQTPTEILGDNTLKLFEEPEEPAESPVKQTIEGSPEKKGYGGLQKKERSKKSKKSDEPAQPKTVKRKIVLEDNIETDPSDTDVDPVDVDLSFLNDKDEKERPMKKRLRQMLKEPERKIYFSNLCDNCCQRTKVYEEDLCSPCKRAENSRAMTEVRRKHTSQKKALKLKKDLFLQKAAAKRRTLELELENDALDDDLKLLDY